MRLVLKQSTHSAQRLHVSEGLVQAKRSSQRHPVSNQLKTDQDRKFQILSNVFNDINNNNSWYVYSEHYIELTSDAFRKTEG
jgi:hypothetical protein